MTGSAARNVRTGHFHLPPVKVAWAFGQSDRSDPAGRPIDAVYRKGVPVSR
jgi:hypothetical protein